MIVSVTLNPCIDKTLAVPAWNPGDNVRGTAVREVVGGKGNNVARSLKALGHEVRPAMFLGGVTGKRCEELLRSEDGLDPIVAESAASTRVILTVRGENNAQTAFFDPDPAISPAEADALYAAVEKVVKAGGVTALTLSGSSPSPATNGSFSDLISLARSKRVPVFLDTYGAALEGIWGFWPDVLQVNRREAAAHLGIERVTESDIAHLLAKWARHKVKIGIVTNGPDAVLARVDGMTYRITPPDVDVVNPIGSGDCLLAGVVEGWLRGDAPETLLKHAVACGVANAMTWDAGAITPEAVARTEALVTIETA